MWGYFKIPCLPQTVPGSSNKVTKRGPHIITSFIRNQIHLRWHLSYEGFFSKNIWPYIQAYMMYVYMWHINSIYIYVIYVYLYICICIYICMWCWRRLLRIPWTARRSNQSIIKEISPEYSLEELMLKVKLQYFGHLMQRTDSKDPDAGKDWRREEKGTTEDEMVGWHHRLDGHEFE